MATTEILMPELGESVHEGSVSRWLKGVGEAVKEDEPVVEIMTDKVNTELQAPASGVLVKILIKEGDNVKVFEPLGLIGDAADAPTAEEAPKSAPVEKPAEATLAAEPPAQPPAPEPAAPATIPMPVSENGGRRWYTPLVRSMAKERGVSDAELAAIVGSGEGGRVTKKDLEGYIASGRATQIPSTPAVSPVAAPAPEFKPAAPAAPGREQEIIALVGMRKAISEAMTRAHAIPAVTTITQVDVSKLVEFRKANKDTFQQMYGVKLTYTPFFIKAATEALIETPYVNSSLGDDGKLTVNHAVHMGIAVALGDGSQGLVVPVIRDCHKKNLIEIARDLEGIAKKAREIKLEIADYQGGTFTLTNPGTYGAMFGTPMIAPSQVGILGTYAIQETVIAKDGMFGIKPIMHLVLTYDHRVVDGMLAGKFLKAIRDRLESFDFFR
ncbi:MAG: 2-oxo acid dehydrogenase subunit E2 [Armatimonadetes bacterium]|nr:2-oxo acid dehydrogenase subunit E2 [Armatimonadota bacterium]